MHAPGDWVGVANLKVTNRAPIRPNAGEAVIAEFDLLRDFVPFQGMGRVDRGQSNPVA